MPKKLIAIAAVVLTVVAGVFSLRASRPRHERRQQLMRVSAFWHADEAFVFADAYGEARRHVEGLERLPLSFQAFAWQAGWEESRGVERTTIAYRVSGAGVQRFDLGTTALWVQWDLTDDGRLQAVSRPEDVGLRLNPEEASAPGFRWNGTDFTRLPVELPRSPAPARTLRPEEEEVEGTPEPEYGPVSEAAKARLRDAGWKHRFFSAGEAVVGAVELPMELASGTAVLHLTKVESTPTERRHRLEVRTPRLQETLLNSGDWQPMEPAAFERLPSHLPPGSREHPLTLLARVHLGFLPVLCVLMMGWLAISGPTRALKIGLLVFMVVSALATALVAGPAFAFGMFVVPLSAGVVALPIACLVQRYRIRRSLLPADAAACPAFGRERLRAWTQGFEEGGFRTPVDRIHVWWMLRKERRTFVRLMRHESGEAIANFAFNERPRFDGRALISFVGPAPLVTCDRPSNQELLPDGLTKTQRVPRAATCAEMTAAHLAFARKAGTPRPIDDVEAADAEAWNVWARRLVESGQAIQNGETFRADVLISFGASLRMLRAWLH